MGKAIDGAINRATNSASEFLKNQFPDIDIDNIEGFDDLAANDPCLQGDAVFDNPLCLGATNKNTYDGLREARCVIDSSNSDLCTTTIERVCVDIDHALCTDEIYVTRRKVRDDRLEAARLEVVFADWTDGVTNATPSNTHTSNQFLSGLSGVLGSVLTTQALQDIGLSSSEEAAEFSVTDGDSSGTLTLALKQSRTTDSNGNEIRPAYDIFTGGNVADGVVFVAGQYTPTGCVRQDCAIHRYYAGLLPSTDLGEPLTAAPAQGTWKGQIQSVGDVVLDSAFDINFTFNTTTNGGTIAAYVVDGTNALRIDGVFDDQGVVTGSTQWGSVGQNRQVSNPSGGLISPGTLRGLIGQEGAVAAFISEQTGIQPAGRTNAAGYAGGFVAYLTNPLPTETCITAKTCVDYTHWAEAANLATTATANRFLAGTPTGLTTGERNPVVNVMTLAGGVGPNALGGEATDGFAIFRAGSAHNAGILSTTRLGAPLDEIATAEWNGSFFVRVGRSDIANTTLRLMVSYDGSAGTITSASIGSGGAYTFTNVGFNDVGIITGMITRTADAGAGIVSGLIGADGAVAVFHSNADATASYVGGFVAVPPSGS